MSLIQDAGNADHIQGNPDAPVALLEYGDYECPHCGAAYPVVKQIQKKMGRQLQFVFRNFPLTNMHPFAEIAAEAAEAASAQGRFWEMHDALYENQDSLSEETIFALAEKIGLDMEAFTKDIESQKYRPKVKKDFMGGVKSGVNGTPTFFINGERFDQNFDGQLLLEALRSAAV
jgi:protein-disulfide isomerase